MKLKLILIGLLAFVLGFGIGFIKDKAKTSTKAVSASYTATITDVKYDTVYIDHYKTVKMPLYDTLVCTDTVCQVDSVLVSVPISVYTFDTTVWQGDTVKTQINGFCKGFDVRVGQLSTLTTITPKKAVSAPCRWYNRLGVGVGLGITYDDSWKVLPCVGIMYRPL